ncbi:MAG TPA: IclR family transcriptional regulator C-terminal domain-containing protein [Xanthobacteraceae bacterium]|jgi:IclR family pca regulon transcriptional regulator|nr:IclR family transcriptional regulator C-terminal domain-containing protein [Xanthobacteraceae bacterium]
MPAITRSASQQALIETSGPEFLEALARGLRVIEAFNQDHRQLTLSDIAKLVDLPRASVRRTLHTLVQLGYAEMDDRMFRLRPRVLNLARAYLQSNAVTDIVQPALEGLSQQTGESCSAAVLDGEDVIMIAHASPKRVLPVSAQIGFRLPAVATALGRVLLAALDDRELDKFLAQLKPEKITKLTVTDKTRLRKIILEVRKSGYAVADQEVEIGFRSLAIPLKKRDDRVIAALNIGVHSERTPLKAMHGQFFQSLQAMADELQQLLI